MATYTPGGDAAAWIQNVYSKKIHVNAYQKQKIAPNWNDLNEESQDGKPGSSFTWFTHQNLARVAFATTDTGDSLTFQSNTETSVTGSASAYIIPVQISQLTLNRMMLNPKNTLRESIELSLAEQVDVICGQKYSSIATNSVGGAGQDITKALILVAQGKLSATAGHYFDQGVTECFLEYHHSQHNAVFNIPDITAAYARGDKANPNVTGIIVEALGSKFVQSGNIYRNGGITYNCLHIRLSHGIGYNQRMSVDLQKYLYAHRLLGIVDFMAMEQKDEYACLVQTQ